MRRYVTNLRERTRELGPRYAVLAPVRRAAELVQHRTERELLRIEGDRGVLGLAHRAWRDHAPEVNREHWGGWDWQHRGEEWTPSEAWKQGLVDEVLLPTIPPGGTVLEIGPGAGRWTAVLAPRADRLVVVDLDARILERCRETLGPLADRVELHLGDGSSLAMLGDAEVDAVWSFDVWVHIAPLGQQAYLAELARVLRKPGTC
jgi:SAM-dependent methyltransferase